MEDKAKGRAKEAAGAVTGDEEKKAEGQAQQRKLPRRPRPGRPRRKPRKLRGSVTGSGARTRGLWATLVTPSRGARRPKNTFPSGWGPRVGLQPFFRTANFREHHL